MLAVLTGGCILLPIYCGPGIWGGIWLYILLGGWGWLGGCGRPTGWGGTWPVPPGCTYGDCKHTHETFKIIKIQAILHIQYLHKNQYEKNNK